MYQVGSVANKPAFALSRRGARAHRSASAGRCRSTSAPRPRIDRAHQGGQAARARGHHGAARSAAGRPDRRRVRPGLRGERAGKASACPRSTPPRSSRSSTRKSMRPSPIQNEDSTRRPRLTWRSRFTRRLRQADRHETDKWAKVIKFAGIKAGLIRARLVLPFTPRFSPRRRGDRIGYNCCTAYWHQARPA